MKLPTSSDYPLVIHGDCVEVLKGLPDACIDAVVTDPPYGLEFMGKEWDAPWKTSAVGRGVNVAQERASEMTETGKGHSTSAGPYLAARVDSTRIAGLPFQQWCHTWLVECHRVLKPGGHALIFGGTRTFHRMAVAVEDAGFEIRDSIAWLYGCLSDDTDALTRRGWVRGVDLRPDDEVAQWDDGALTWVQPSRITVAPYAGPMVNLANRHTDQLLTPNHRVYAKVRKNARDTKPTQWTVTEAQDMRPSWIVDLPLAGVLAEGAAVDPEYAYLAGWWFTDAWRHGDGKAAMFSQCKPKTLAKLRAALAPHNPSEYIAKAKAAQHSPEHTFYVTGELAAKLIAEWPTRTLDWSVLGWDLRARLALLEGLLDGDGSRQAGRHTVTFWSCDAARREIVAALFVSCGWRASDDGHGAVYANPRGTSQIQKRHRDAAPVCDYSGLVWCVTVPAGAFVARRNGRAFITGNSGFPKSLNVSKAIDKAAGAEREVVGVKLGVRGADGTGHENAMPGKATGVKQVACDVPITAPATDAAKQWDGWGTALKPAFEPIVVARKPLIGTVAANVLAHGTGALNVDGCRVGSEALVNPPMGAPHNSYGGYAATATATATAVSGRWPANVVLDDYTAAIVDEQSGTSTSVRSAGRNGSDEANATWGLERGDDQPRGHNDTGGASRFFYTAKAPGQERPSYYKQNCDCEDSWPTTSRAKVTGGTPAVDDSSTLRYGNATTGEQSRAATKSTTLTATNLTMTPPTSKQSPQLSTSASIQDASSEMANGSSRVQSADNSSPLVQPIGTSAKKVGHSTGDAENATLPKWSKTSRCAVCGTPARSEAHATVKPLDLMRWLVRLVTPPGGLVLEPFAGSGTTVEACIHEHMRCVAIEREADYLPLIDERINRNNLSLFAGGEA